jgi:hypothetical protein
MSEQRLLDVDAAAQYLGGISTHTVRALVARGELVPVRLPSCRRTSESNRRLLFDRVSIDALIDKWKRESTGTPNAGLSAASVKGWKLKPVRKRAKEIA